MSPDRAKSASATCRPWSSADRATELRAPPVPGSSDRDQGGARPALSPPLEAYEVWNEPSRCACGTTLVDFMDTRAALARFVDTRPQRVAAKQRVWDGRNRPDRRRKQQLRRDLPLASFVDITSGVCGPQHQLMLLIGEVKIIEPARYGHKLTIRNSGGQPRRVSATVEVHKLR